MLPQPRYDVSIVSLSNSLRKHYGCDVYHKTLPELDAALEKRPYKNVILLVLDGLGQAQLENALSARSFLRRHWKRSISSVFPPTTVAAVSAIETGLTPAETGWLGWRQWFEELGTVVDMFSGRDSEGTEILHKPNPGPTHLPKNSLWDDITKAGQARGHCLMCFGPGRYNSPRDMVRRLLKISREDGRQFAYCYEHNPDHTLHIHGNGHKSRRIIKRLDSACARLARKMRETLLVITADHGHIEITRHMAALKEYPALLDTLRCGTDIESRALGCRVKPGREDDFMREARAAFGPDTEILSKADVLRLKIFGNLGEDQDYPRLLERMPDFLLLPPPGAEIGGTKSFKSSHGGSDPREMKVPLFLASNTSRQ